MPDAVELRPNQTIVFTGDSITDAGRRERAYRPFGNGYAHFTAYYLLARYPQFNFRIINTGINGNTVCDLEQRWKRDCLEHRPDVLSVLIGINDIWRIHTPGREAEGVALALYEKTYSKLLSQVKQQGDCQIVLMEPFMFCEDTDNPMFGHLLDYINVVHSLAEQFDALIVPLQAAINKSIKTIASDKWSDDTVHPYVWTHAWISQRWIEATKV
jgi:lysophospholipase L1-like esterase